MKRAAKRRLAERRARRTLDQVEVREVDNPLEELRRLTSEAVAFKDVMASEAAAAQAGMNEDRRHAAVTAFGRELDRCGRLLSRWAEAGYEEQWLQLSAARTMLVALALVGTLEELGFEGEQLDDAQRRLAENLQFYADHREGWMPSLEVLDSVRSDELEARTEVKKLMTKIDDMARNMERAKMVAQRSAIEAASVHTDPVAEHVVTDPKTGKPLRVFDPDPPPPPPRESEPAPSKGPRVHVADIRLPELDPFARVLPSIAGRRPAPEPEPDSKDTE